MGNQRAKLASGTLIATAIALTGRAGSADSETVSHSFEDSVVPLVNARGLACSGAIVAPRHVLTARHCLPLKAVIVKGKADSAAETIAIVGSSVPPNRLDLALVELAQPAPVAALRIASHPGAFPKRISVGGFGTRFGKTGEQERRPHIRHAVVREWGCAPGRTLELGCSTDSDLVLSRGVIEDTCQGDSGAPVLERRRGDVRVIAVTSRSIRRSLLDCGDGGVYVRVDVASDWIRSVIQQRGRRK